VRVLLTGASSGIGAETARLLARRDHDVVLVARGREGLERAAEEVRAHGTRAVVAVADVTDREALAAALQRGKDELGGIDAVIANAGATAYGPVADMPVEDMERTLDVTLRGMINLVAVALPELERTAGHIVVTGSVAARQPLPLMAAYTAAKHGERGFVNALRLELQATGSPVQVAMVHPGPVDTPFWDHVVPTAKMPPLLPAAYRPQDVARAIVRQLESPRPEHVPGLAMRAMLLFRALARPVSDLALVAAANWALQNGSDRPPGRALHEASGDGTRTTEIDLHLGAWKDRALEALRP